MYLVHVRRERRDVVEREIYRSTGRCTCVDLTIAVCTMYECIVVYKYIYSVAWCID